MGLTERHRPKKLADVIGQEEVKEKVQNCIDRGAINFPTHLMFIGPPGSGKTTMAQIVAMELWKDMWKQHYEEFNASDDRGIKVVREEIKTKAMVLTKKMIFLTEFDQMTSEAQHALRRIMEKYKDRTIFVIDGNIEHNIIAPIKSRCAVMRFRKLKNREILQYLLKVLVKEKISFDPKDLSFKQAMTKLTVLSDGDLRFALNNLDVLISKKKELTYKNVVELFPAEEANIILKNAIGGNLVLALSLLEDYLNQSKRWEELFTSWSAFLRNMPLNEDDEQNKANKKALAYNIMFQMASFEDRCRRGNSPFIQLSGFLAYVWRAPALLVKQSATT